MAWNENDGIAVTPTGTPKATFNEDAGVPVDTGFHEDNGIPADSTPSTFKYSSNEEYEDLRRAVGYVGYSGLDENQKKLFDSQLPMSKAAKAGMTPQEIRDYVDQAAGVNEANSNAGNAWTLGRSILSLPWAALGGLIGGFDKYIEDPMTGMAVERIPGSSYLERVNVTQNQILEDSKNNQGFGGFISNPANVVGGLATAPLKIASPFVRGAIEGAGVSAVDQYENTGKVDPLSVAGGALFGGVVSKAGSMLGNRVRDYQDYKKSLDLMENDPLTYAFDHPAMAKNSFEKNKLRQKIDPMDLATEYNWAISDDLLSGTANKLDPMDQRRLLDRAKKDIVERSLFNRKVSSVTDREAREHIENIMEQIDNFKYSPLEPPASPLLATKAYLAAKIENTFPLNFLDDGGVRGLAGTGATGINALTKIGASPVGEFLRKIPVIPLGVTGIDRLNK